MEILDKPQALTSVVNQALVPDLSSDREPTSPASSTSKNLSSDLLNEKVAPDPEDQAVYDDTYSKAVQLHQKRKVEAQSEADIEARTPEGQAYAERLRQLNQPVSKVDSILAKIRQQVRLEPRQQCMDYDDARKIVTELLIVRLARENKKLHFTSEQKGIIADITAYFIADPGSNIPLTKGIYLYGDVGVGKSFIMNIMRVFCELAEINNMRFSEVSTKSLLQEVADENTLRPIRKYFSGNVLLDDLGEEKRDLKLYGNLENPMDLLITERYRNFQEKGHFTHITSNLPPNKLDIYGTRLFDRFSDMVHPVLLPGGSKRG